VAVACLLRSTVLLKEFTKLTEAEVPHSCLVRWLVRWVRSGAFTVNEGQTALSGPLYSWAPLFDSRLLFVLNAAAPLDVMNHFLVRVTWDQRSLRGDDISLLTVVPQNETMFY